MAHPSPRRPACLGVLLAAAASLAQAQETRAAASSVVLITLDTTRADVLGAYGGRAATPALDGLATRGVRYTGAITASPLTLPAHASLLTGLDPPEHGVLDNGIAALSSDVPTLASVLAGRGYATAAFVASRVLDRRFGLARGFATYDDRMAAEQLGEYGYPERDADAVTDAALGWLATRPRARAVFLWVHYYDPHAPYAPGAGADDAARYAGEVAAVDRQVARLLKALPAGAGAPVVAAVADHGESLGEHGERGHGLFLYGPVVTCPSSSRARACHAGRVVDGPVASRRLAPTLALFAGRGRRAAGRACCPGSDRRRRRGPSTARPGCPRPRTGGARCAPGRTRAGATSTRRGRNSTSSQPTPGKRATGRAATPRKPRACGAS